jgi:hypothetical protein
MEVDIFPVRCDPASFWQDLSRTDPVAIEIDAAQGWASPAWQALGDHLPPGQEVGLEADLPCVLGDTDGEVLFGPGVQLPVATTPLLEKPAGDHGGHGARADHAGHDVLDLLAAKFGEMEVDGATTFLAKVLSMLPPSVMGAIPPVDAPKPRAGRRKKQKGELLPSRCSSRTCCIRRSGMPLPCVLEESPTVALGLGGGAAAVEPPCSSPLDADEIARIRLDTGVLQGARIALPDNELLSILDMEA